MDGSINLNPSWRRSAVADATHALRTIVFRRQLRSPVTKPTRTTDRRCAGQVFAPRDVPTNVPPTPRLSHPGNTILRCILREIRHISVRVRYEELPARASSAETISAALRVVFSQSGAELSTSAVSAVRPFCVS